MAYFALLNDMSIVESVIFVDNVDCLNEEGFESEAAGINYCKSLYPGNWIQTSYNASIRKNYAGIGYTYDKDRNAFISPQPYESWILDEETCKWICPVPRPSEGLWKWDEDIKNWTEIVDTQEN